MHAMRNGKYCRQCLIIRMLVFSGAMTLLFSLFFVSQYVG